MSKGPRGIRFNFAPAGATTPEMIEPLAKRINELGWHIQINAPAAKIIEIIPILEKVPSPIVFDHLAHIPEPEGVNHPLFAQVRALAPSAPASVEQEKTAPSANSTPEKVSDYPIGCSVS